MNCTASSGEFAKPVPNVTVNSNYGIRVHPVTGEIKAHQGVDLACKNPDVIYSSKEGRVVFAEYPTNGLNTLGNVVVIEHENKLFTIYAHLSKIDVKVGQEIGQLEPVGRCGTTGRSTGDHLHFEVRTGSMFGAPVNPMSYLEKKAEE